MKQKILVVLLVFLCFKCFAVQNIDEAILSAGKDVSFRCEERDIVAILGFESETSEMSEYLSGQLAEVILENSNLRVVTRQHMDKIDSELDFQYSGYVSDETVLSICQRLGAQKIIFGQLDELKDAYVFQIKMLEVETAAYSLVKKYTISRSPKTEQLLHHSARVYKSSVGLIFEANKNSLSYVSPAIGFSFDYNLSRRLSFGLKTLASHDVFEKENSIYTIEGLCFLRWYTVSPFGEPCSGLFIEGQGGVDVLLVNSKVRTVPNCGGALGFRFVRGKFYAEPSFRLGYPYIFGMGTNIGFRF